MEPVSKFECGNRKAEIHQSFDGSYTVFYYINEKLLNKTHHIEQFLAEEVADDFISEAVSKQFLSE